MPPTRRRGREAEVANWVKMSMVGGRNVLLNMDSVTSVMQMEPDLLGVFFGETDSDTAFKVASDIDTLTLLLDAKDLTQ